MVDYSPGAKPRILYVDDEADNLQTFRALFRREYDIRVAESAKDALEMLRREQIDVLISDQRMPGMTGVELLEQAAAEFPDTLRFMLTGFSDFDPLVDAINQGRIQGYFTKPLNPDEIKGRIQKGLETLYLRASNEQLLEELKQNQDFLNAVIDNTPDMIIVSDANNSRLIMVNRAGDELLGHSHEELLGRRIHELFPKQEESLPGKEREFLNGKVLCDIPRETIQTRHKGERVLHTRKIPIPDDRGVPKYVLSISEDITEQKQTEEALLESEKQYRNIIENAIEGIFQTTPEGGYRTINPAFAHMFGYDSPGEMMTAVPNIEEHLYVRPEDRKRLIALLSGSEGRVRDFEVQLRRRDGSPLWVSMNVRMVRNGEGNPLFLEGTCVDISERKLAEDALRKSEALLNQVGQIAKIGGWEMDLITRKANWTRETYDIVEIEPGEPIPGPDEHVSYYLPEYRPLVAEAMRALIEEDKPLDFEAQLLTTKGNVKWCHAIGMAVCEGGECIKVHGTFQDVTQR
ncbi:MAG TPA: PAS domain S-box protein, partial [Syntrophobacteraceae bacterium]|nr:PAS domain S-box protein [Syntrophobacteraceae bacterium]